MLAAVDEKVEAGEVSRDATAGEARDAPRPRRRRGAQVIDLAELLSRSIKGAAKPGPAKTKAEADDGRGEAREGQGRPKKKRATG